MTIGQKITAAQLVLSVGLGLAFSVFARVRWGRACSVVSAYRGLLWHTVPLVGIPFLMGHLWGTDSGVAHLVGYLLGAATQPGGLPPLDEDGRGRRATTAFVLGMAAWQVGYDVFAAVWWGNDATISMVLRHASLAAPAVAFTFGLLAGSLFGLDRRRLAIYGTSFFAGVLLWGQLGDARFREAIRPRRDEDARKSD